MAVRRLVLFGQSESVRLHQRLESAFARWQREWCADEPSAVEIVNADRSEIERYAEIEWHVGSFGIDNTVSIGVTGPDNGELASLFVGSSHETSHARGKIADDLIQSALRDLIVGLFDESGTSKSGRPIGWNKDAPGDDMWERIKGFVVMRCRIGVTDLYVVLHPLITQGYLGTNPPRHGVATSRLSSRRDTLDLQATVLQVFAGAAELTLPELGTLTVGDVITLEGRLQQPVSVALERGTVICAGHLGFLDGRKAIQLTSLRESNEV